jgi:hypothetical protein
MEGDELVKEGQSAKSAFFLTRGTVEIESRRPNEASTLLESPAWFGDLSLFNHGIVRTATVRAVDATSAIEVRQEVIVEMSAKYPHMSKLHEEYVNEAEKDRSAFLNGGLKTESVEKELRMKKMGFLQRIGAGFRAMRPARGMKEYDRKRANTSTFASDPNLQIILGQHGQEDADEEEYSESLSDLNDGNQSAQDEESNDEQPPR